ncbi:hypothetical protein HYW99_01120 [Candidatus Woesearchaeota archaeon]|nr:hypothetical protein [Candidatus Woesearchaeota archaeon]
MVYREILTKPFLNDVKDVNDAWEVQQRIQGLDEFQKKEFIEGFEKGWKEVKKEKNKLC